MSKFFSAERQRSTWRKLLSRQLQLVHNTAAFECTDPDTSLDRIDHITSILHQLDSIDIFSYDPFLLDPVVERLNKYTEEDNFDNEVWILFNFHENYRFWRK